MAQEVPFVARWELKYRTPDDIVENVYYVRTSDTDWTEALMDDVEAVFSAWEDTDASLLRNDGVALYSIIATDLTSLAGIRKAYSIEPTIPGTLPDGLPANATIAVKADIGRRGRGTSGRTFWVGMAAEQLASMDQLDNTAAASIVNALEELRTNIAAVSGIDGLCVPHFVVGAVRPATVDSDQVVRYSLSDFFMDSQRNRLPFHKKHKLPPVA